MSVIVNNVLYSEQPFDRLVKPKDKDVFIRHLFRALRSKVVQEGADRKVKYKRGTILFKTLPLRHITMNVQ